MRGWRALVTGVGGALLVLAFILPLPARAADTPLQLAVILNGQNTGLIGEFVQRGDELLVRPEEWAALGLRPEIQTGADGLAPLSAIAGLRWRLDAATQTLTLEAPAALLLPTRLAPPPLRASTARVESGTGVTLNYDVTGSVTDGAARASGLFDMRAFSPFGTASTGLIARTGPAAAGTRSLVRLDSSLTYADPDSLRRYRLGDFIGGGLAWTRPVRMAGLQIQSDFKLRPDLITFPLPAVLSSAAVPSTVDVLINNTPFLSQQVPPGPFEVAQLPVVTGAGTVTTTITNALGQQVTATLPFYASADLLAAGLESFSLEIGWMRRNWGLVSDDYRLLAAAGTYRRGLSDILTAEGHAEASAGLILAGAGLSANLFNFASFDLALAGSIARGRKGGQLSVGLNRLSPGLSLGVSAIFADGDFRDLAALNGAPPPARLITANASLALGRYGAVGLAYTGIARRAADPSALPDGGLVTGGFTGDRRTVPAPDLATLTPAERADVLSANYSVQLGTFSLYATGFHDFAGNGGGAMLGLTMPLGARSSASVGAGLGSDGAYAQFQAVQTPVTEGDWGYQAYATSRPDHQFVDVQYKSRWGLAAAGLDRLGGGTTLRAQAQGALSAVEGGGVFASNTIHDSFAVVDTSGVPGVTVLEENRVVGRTDEDGRILVPGLRAFEANRISIEPNDVPVTSSLAFAAREVRPQDRSGVVVRFPIERSHAAIVKLTDEKGAPLPVGSTATLAETGAILPMGYEGAVYAERLKPGTNRLTVVRPDGGRCSAAFEYREASDTIPTIGPILCKGT